MIRIPSLLVPCALLGTILVSGCCLYAQQPGDTDVTQGKVFLARLSQSTPPDLKADHLQFQQVGFDQAEKLLFAVQVDGQRPSATANDWISSHRALDALVELKSDEKEFLKASIYATLQESAYRRNEGNYSAALAAARETLDLQKQSGQVASLSVPLKSIGEDLLQLGRIDEGAAALYQARSQLQDPTAPFAGDLWSEIISMESSRGNSKLAHEEADQFLHAADTSAPAIFRAYGLLSAANLAIDDHHYDEAVTRIHEALHAVKTAPSKSVMVFAYQTINTLLTLGTDAMQSMPYEQALSLCARLDKEFSGLLPVSISGFARQVANHRRLLAGEFDLVLRDDSERLDEARTASDVSGQLSALMALAVDYAYVRESIQRLAALEEASEIVHSAAGAGIPLQLRFLLLNSLAAARLDQHDLRQARNAYDEVLTGIEAVSSEKLRSQLGSLYAEAELGKAAVIERDGNLVGARAILRQSLDPPAASPAKFTRSTVLLQFAQLEQTANQNPEEVVHLYTEAIAALHQENEVNTEVYARLQLVQYLAANTIGSIYHPPEQPFLAGEQLFLARSASTSVGLADSVWRIAYLQGILDENAQNGADAVRSYSLAIDSLDRIRAGLSVQEERESFIDSASVQDLYSRLIKLLTDAGNRDKAWEYVERFKAHSFLESLQGRHFASTPSASTAIASKTEESAPKELEEEILSARGLLSPGNDSTLRSSGRLPEVVQAKLLVLENRFALARQQEALQNSRSTQPLALRPISEAATQARLPGHTALIEYAVLDHEMAAFVVTHTSARELHWPADTAALPDQLRQLRVQLSSSRPPPDLDAHLSEVSKALLTPVLSSIPEDIDNLIVIPTQTLSLIPFGALPLPSSPSRRAGRARLMVDRFSISYLPSASTLQFLHFGSPSSSPDLFLGALGETSVEGWPALPGTLKETATIEKLYPRSSRVTGSAFTHDAAIKGLLEHEEVHFATHGLYDEQAPLFSALLTAPAKGQPSRLSLYEVMDLKLKSRLVILSACETDRGQLSGGDEITGLTRTFLQAGAENVVSSLWKVSDDSTTFLMESLHAHLRLGESTPAALRHAQLATRTKFPEPYFWAAFLDTGLR